MVPSFWKLSPASKVLILALAFAAGAKADTGPLRLIPPPTEQKSEPAPAFDPYADLRKGLTEGLTLDGPYYQSDSVAAALRLIPTDAKLGPPDLADYGWIDRMSALGERADRIGKGPRHQWDMLGMRCAGFICKVPGTSCIVTLVLILFGCSF